MGEPNGSLRLAAYMCSGEDHARKTRDGLVGTQARRAASTARRTSRIADADAVATWAATSFVQGPWGRGGAAH